LLTHLLRYRHAADKLQKTENVMEKYKKKLEESADLRRNIKARLNWFIKQLYTNSFTGS